MMYTLTKITWSVFLTAQVSFFFFFNDTATTEIYTLSLHDALPIVGLGVDGSASNERGDLLLEVKQALLVARGRGGPTALTVRDALRLGTRGGAALLGRDDIGSLEPGKRADLAIWRSDGLELGGAD